MNRRTEIFDRTSKETRPGQTGTVALHQSRSSPGFFDGHDLFGRLSHGWEFYQQFFSLYKQQERFAELQELCMVDVSAVDHSRPPVPDWLRFGCQQVTASPQKKPVEGYLQMCLQKPTRSHNVMTPETALRDPPAQQRSGSDGVAFCENLRDWGSSERKC
jgi:hypothetical protein